METLGSLFHIKTVKSDNAATMFKIQIDSTIAGLMVTFDCLAFKNRDATFENPVL